MKFRGSKFLDLGGDRQAKLLESKLGDASHAAFAREHGLPHLSGGVAYAQIRPMPVKLRPCVPNYLPPFEWLGDVIDGRLHGADFFRVFIGNFDVESLLRKP